MGDLDYKEINQLSEVFSLNNNDEIAVDVNSLLKKIKYSNLKSSIIAELLSLFPDEDIDFTGDNTHAGSEAFNGVVTYNSQSLCQWYRIEDPTAGWFAQKTSGWTADRFTAASGGMEIDFSSVVPAGTKKVKVFLRVSPGAQYDVYCRPAGDDTFASNTPVANNEYFATISSMIFYSTGSAGGGRLVDLRLNGSGVCEIAVSNTGMDLNFSYPVEVYAPIPPV